MKREILALSMIALVVGACTVMNGLELQTNPTDPGETSGSSSGKTSGSTSGATGTSGGSSGLDPDKCNHVREPAKPAASDPGGTDTTLTFAMRQLVPNNEGEPFGLDLDNLCTCFTEKGQTTPGPDACKRTTSACDDPGFKGRDNAGAVLFKQIANAGGVNLIDIANGHVSGGKIGIVVHIEGYNGLANDDAVSVRFIRVAGIAGGPNPAKVDAWPDSDDSFSSTEAYVVNRTLVARFTEVEVPFLISTPTPAKMKGAIVMGTITDGVIPDLLVAGRTNTGELINSVGELEVSFGTGSFRLCESMEFDDAQRYRSFSAAACKVSDMPTDTAKTGDLTTPCDAMSFGVKMLVIPATLSATKQPVSTSSPGCNEVSGYPLPCPSP